MRILSIIAVIAATATPALAERNPNAFVDSYTSGMSEQVSSDFAAIGLNGSAGDDAAMGDLGDHTTGPSQTRR